MDDERPRVSPGLDRYVYWPGTMVPETEAVNVKNRSHRVTSQLELQRGDEGALVSQGTRFGGWTLFVQDGLLHPSTTSWAEPSTTSSPTDRSPRAGLCSVDVRVHPHRRARGRRPSCWSTARSSPTGAIPHTVPCRFGVGSGSLRVGDDAGISVTQRVRVPVRFHRRRASRHDRGVRCRAPRPRRRRTGRSPFAVAPGRRYWAFRWPVTSGKRFVHRRRRRGQRTCLPRRRKLAIPTRAASGTATSGSSMW